MNAADFSNASPTPLGRFAGTVNPRERRAIGHLLQHGDMSREDMDNAAGASNSPDVIRRLRGRGLPRDTCLTCHDRHGTDRDGREVRFGVYALTDEGKRRVREWLTREGLTVADLVVAGRV